jgi:hypothetical protein
MKFLGKGISYLQSEKAQLESLTLTDFADFLDEEVAEGHPIMF